MTNLPSNQNASTHLSQERAEHREWIGGRSITLLSHYWRHDDPVELTAAIGADWADVIEGLPQDFIQRACVKYMRDEPRRKPTPGAIYQIALEDMPKPELAPMRKTTAEEDAAYRALSSNQKIDPDKKAFADQVMATVFNAER